MQPDEGSAERKVRAAQNQALFREVNERLERLASAFHEAAHTPGFACECADIACTDQLALTIDEYEALRTHGNRFAVLPGHVLADVERVVSENDRFALVEKLDEGARIALETNPRAS